jgi:hypothetical protein
MGYNVHCEKQIGGDEAQITEREACVLSVNDVIALFSDDFLNTPISEKCQEK